MSKRQTRQKGGEKKRSTNHNNQANKLEDILGDIQKKGIQMQLGLSTPQIQTLNAQHQLLISSSSMLELLKSFDKEMHPYLQDQSSPQMIKLYTTWRQWMENSIQKNNAQRRDLISKLIDPSENQARKNPMDDYQKRKSHILSRQIRERQEFFKIKTNFATYAKNHFEKPTQEIKDFVDYKAKRVDEILIQQMFKKKEQIKLGEINNYFQDKEREENKKLLSLLKQAAKINKLDFQKKELMRRQKLKNQKLIKLRACKELGNSVSLLVNLHDAFTFAKK